MAVCEVVVVPYADAVVAVTVVWHVCMLRGCKGPDCPQKL